MILYRQRFLKTKQNINIFKRMIKFGLTKILKTDASRSPNKRVNRQPTDLGKLINIYSVLLQLKMKAHPNRIMSKILKRHFTKEDI